MDKHPIEIAAQHVGSYKALADILGVTKGAVHQWMLETRRVPIEHCAAIEQATNGLVTRQMLRPNDWKSIWPELDSNGDIAKRSAASDDTQNNPGGAVGGSSGKEKLAKAA
ncbi:transcriptional regulator [Paraburkholderia sp. J11-2]|uniref:transcriptional regulator n=1 Tax=Paraburkholderia sp. J11-2 TaxID=2805431 RepID=UPI002AB63FA0|nr:Cro/CI family transcriptional regulator [Paraburkholderia sp. J11-2]